MLNAAAIGDLVGARASDPFALLGMHQRGGRVWVTALLPGAHHVEVLSGVGAVLANLPQVHPDGLFDGALAQGQARCEYRLRVRWEIIAEVRPLSVPPMLLQTLVENAVKYGISARRDGGELVIAARLAGEALNIRVTNPGDLAAPTSASAARAGSSTGVGLRNASERLNLLFGERATLALLNEPAGCVTADVLIPLDAPTG